MTLAGAVWHQPGQGRIAVLGSVSMFDDKWIDKEENSKVMDFIFKWLRPVSVKFSGLNLSRTNQSFCLTSLPPACFQGSAIPLNDLDAEEPDVSDLKLLPDTQSLAEKLKGCLQVRPRFSVLRPLLVKCYVIFI